MSGIAGVNRPGETTLVTKMLDKISYRGHGQPIILESLGNTLGVYENSPEWIRQPVSLRETSVWDGPRPPMPIPDQISKFSSAFSLASATPEGLILARDTLGVRPLYYGYTDDGAFCFASEVKALMEATYNINEFPPGYWMDHEQKLHQYHKVEVTIPSNLPPEVLVGHLRLLLEKAILRRIEAAEMGSWLSGGLDSSAIASLVRPHVKTLHSFAGGFEGSPDIEYARQVATFLDTKHHEVIVTVEELINVLPDVIYHMESFDALLIRSTLMNYLVAREASQYVHSSFSGEGGDELFGGYEYLQSMQMEQLPAELVDITKRLHNTALQRVDRSASAHGLVIYVPLLDKDIVEFALQTPPSMKISRSGDNLMEKSIFRQAVRGNLPEEVLWRPKAKFWEGAGVETLLDVYANEHVSDSDFASERILPNGWQINTREELMYYRIFKEQFGDLTDLDWMGRTKGAPVA